MKFIFFAVCLALEALQTSGAVATDGQCTEWKLNKKSAGTEMKLDPSRRDLLLETGLKLQNISSSDTTATIEESARTYAEASVSTLLPSILLLIVLCLTCFPVWIIFGCCENCCCKKRPDHESIAVPCVIWIVWLVMCIVLAIVIIAAQFSFKKFADGATQTVCDVDGSLGEVSKWIDSLASDVDGLGSKISGFLVEGKTKVFETVDSLEPTIDEVNKTLADVLQNVALSTASITAAFASYDTSGDVSLKMDGLDEQMKNLNKQKSEFKKIIASSKIQVDTMVTQIQGQIEQFPASITTLLKNASTTVTGARGELFAKGSISFNPVPVLLEDGLKDATVPQAVAAGASALQTLVLIMYLPVFIAAPVLLIGGITVIVALMSCKDNKCMAGLGLCGSKCGCALLWLGLIDVLLTSLVFLLLSQVYNDSCSVFSAPEYAIDYMYKNNPTLFKELESAIPKNNFTSNFNAQTAVNTVKQCLAGSSWSGGALSDTMKLDMGLVDSLLTQASASIDSGAGGAIDLGVVDTFIDKSTEEIKKFNARAEGYKLEPAFFVKANNSCTKCSGFRDTFTYFDAYDDKNLLLYGDACEQACKVQLSPRCHGYVPTSTIGPIRTTMVGGVPKLVVDVPGAPGVTQLVKLPEELKKALAAGVSLDSSPCEICRNKTCGMDVVGKVLNRAIDEVSGNLSFLTKSILATNQTIRKTLGSLTGDSGPIKSVISKSGAALRDTVKSVDCEVVGDIFNTIVISVCHESLTGFVQYSWAFVWAGFVGMLLIIATIVLNVCVGLRPLDDQPGAEKELPDQRIELSSRRNLAANRVHNYQSESVPVASAISYVPASVPPVANGVKMTGAGGGYQREQYVI